MPKVFIRGTTIPSFNQPNRYFFQRLSKGYGWLIKTTKEKKVKQPPLKPHLDNRSQLDNRSIAFLKGHYPNETERV